MMTNISFLTQKERDPESSLDFFGERYYSSNMGRFTTVDPLGASAIVADPQSFNRYSYVLNNPLKYVDPDGLNAHDPWSSLTDEERRLLAGKLVSVKDVNKLTKNELNAAKDKFNKMVTATGKGGTLDEKATDANIASVQNFIASLGSDSRIWNEIKSVDSVVSTGAGKQSDIKFTVNNRDNFLSALKATQDAYGYERFLYVGNEQGHIDSTRELGYGVSDPSMHIESNGQTNFSAHWDPTTFFTKPTLKEAILDAVPGGVMRRPYAGTYHWVAPRASTEAVRGSLKEQGLIPQQ